LINEQIAILTMTPRAAEAHMERIRTKFGFTQAPR
jgi:hypothetical protein